VARRQKLYPVVDADGAMTGVVIPSDLLNTGTAGEATVAAVARTDVIVARPDETLRAAADRMAEHWVGAVPVVGPGPERHLLGVLTEFDLLKARHRQLIEERHRERVIRWRRPTVLDVPLVGMVADDDRGAGMLDDHSDAS
jgi:CBS-domain-containing membrane protein